MECSLLTPEKYVELTIPTESLVVCPIRVPCLCGVIHCGPGAFRAEVYPGVCIVEVEYL